ncbi:MAG: hypothetical protein Q4P28_01785 [Tissierellia bacterium]|nr:hypothetical protein [Tissierellia bacterium]
MKKINDYRFIVLTDSLNTYGIVRALGEEGYTSDVIDVKKSYSAFSKYVNFIKADSMKEKDLNDLIIQRLMELKEQNIVGIVFATSDDGVDYLAKNRELINNYGVALVSSKSCIKICNNKKKTVERAKEVGVPYPESLYFDNLAEMEEREGELRYPVLLKPEKTSIFVQKYKKAVIIEDSKEYKQTISEIKDLHLENTPLVLQEYIPGDNHHLYNTSFFYDHEHRLKAISTGYKIRQYPPNTGTMTAGRIEDTPILQEYCEKLMDGLDYYGIGSAEFKYDERDQLFKIIEINPRSVLWNYSATAAGVNMPIMAIEDLKGENLIFRKSIVPIVWLYDSLDLVRYTITNRKKYPDHVLSWFQWKNTLKGSKVMAIRNWEDIRPWLYFLKETFL